MNTAQKVYSELRLILLCFTYRYRIVLGDLLFFKILSTITVPPPHRKVKVSPLQGLKAHGDVDARVHIYTATALGRGRVASSTLGRFYPGESPPGTHFTGGSVDPSTSLDTKELRKSSYSPTPVI